MAEHQLSKKYGISSGSKAGSGSGGIGGTGFGGERDKGWRYGKVRKVPDALPAGVNTMMRARQDVPRKQIQTIVL